MHRQTKPLPRYTGRHPVPWKEGERERLIAEALENGRVIQVPRGASGYDTHTPTQVAGMSQHKSM